MKSTKKKVQLSRYSNEHEHKKHEILKTKIIINSDERKQIYCKSNSN